MWPTYFIEDHQIAASLLNKIKDNAFAFIVKNSNCTEYDVQQFIISQFSENNLVSDYDPPIVGFKENSALVHYFPKKKTAKKLTVNTLVLIDLWAKNKLKKRSPFADITWVAYHGHSVPPKVQKIFKVVRQARRQGLSFIEEALKQKKTPRGKDIYRTVQNYFKNQGYGDEFPGFVGHPLGYYSSVHGRKRNLDPHSEKPIYQNQGYTLEPELDLKGKFGIRSEINFYITRNFRLVITTKEQEQVVLLKPSKT